VGDELASLRRHPLLAEAVGAFVSSLVESYRGNALLNALLGDRGRVLIGLFVLYLDVHPFPGTSERGATLTAVQRLCWDARVCSAGRAASILAAMRFGGYLASRPDPADQRRRILVPTDRLLDVYRAQWASQFRAMAPVFPRAEAVPELLACPSYRRAFLGHLGTAFFAGFRALRYAPVLATVAESTAGILLLSNVALHALTSRPGDPAPISISCLSRRFCVSRAHVRNILATAEQAGLVRYGRVEAVVVLPKLVDALVGFYAALFLLFDRCAADALREVQGRRPELDALNLCQ
jgi:hypothetical protein